MKNTKILLPIILLFSGLFAVINTYEDSYTRINNIKIPFESITMPVLDIDSILEEDENKSGPGVPTKYAHKFDVNYNLSLIHI